MRQVTMFAAALLAGMSLGCTDPRALSDASNTGTQPSATPTATSTPAVIGTPSPTVPLTAPPPPGTSVFLRNQCQCDVFPSRGILVRVKNVGGVARASAVLTVEFSTVPGEPVGILQSAVSGRSLFVMLQVNRIPPPDEPPPVVAERATTRYRLLRSDDEGDTWRSLGERDSSPFGYYLDSIENDGTLIVSTFVDAQSESRYLLHWGSTQPIALRTVPAELAARSRSAAAPGWWWDAPSHSLLSSTRRITVPAVEQLFNVRWNSAGLLAASTGEPSRELIVVGPSGAILRRWPGVFAASGWLDDTHIAATSYEFPNPNRAVVVDTTTGAISEVAGLDTVPTPGPNRYYAPITQLEPRR